MGHIKIQDDQRVIAKDASAQLSAEESFLLSRIGSGMKVNELMVLCPWPKEQSLKLLESLLGKTCIEIQEVKSPKPNKRPEKTADTSYALSSGNTAKLELKKLSKSISKTLEEDKIDPIANNLDFDWRLEILKRLEACAEQNAFEVLDLKPQASDFQIKNHYVKLSRRFHPDRFFRKELGPYKKRLNQLFTHIQKAYESIKNPYDREALVRKIKYQSKSQGECPKSNTPKDKEALLRKLDPQFEKIGKAERYFKLGKEAEKAGRYSEAANQYLIASQINPSKEAYEKAYEKVRPFVEKTKAGSQLKSAQNALEVGLLDDALEHAEKASKADPENYEAILLRAKCLVDLGKMDQLQDAMELLRRAKVNLPHDAESCLYLGRVYQAKSDEQKAIAEYREALKRDPHYSRAKKLLSKLTGEVLD